MTTHPIFCLLTEEGIMLNFSLVGFPANPLAGVPLLPGHMGCPWEGWVTCCNWLSHWDLVCLAIILCTHKRYLEIDHKNRASDGPHRCYWNQYPDLAAGTGRLMRDSRGRFPREVWGIIESIHSSLHAINQAHGLRVWLVFSIFQIIVNGGSLFLAQKIRS